MSETHRIARALGLALCNNVNAEATAKRIAQEMAVSLGMDAEDTEWFVGLVLQHFS